jgi:hypothetical protein
MSPIHTLMAKCSWHCERRFRKYHGRFPVVLWAADYPGGRREFFENWCQAPDGVSDAEVRDALAAEVGEDFRTAGVERFAVSYLITLTTLLRPLETPPPDWTPPPPLRRSAIQLEAHSRDGEHVKALREVAGDRLLAMTASEPADDSRYARLLDAVSAAA